MDPCMLSGVSPSDANPVTAQGTSNWHVQAARSVQPCACPSRQTSPEQHVTADEQDCPADEQTDGWQLPRVPEAWKRQEVPGQQSADAEQTLPCGWHIGGDLQTP